MDIVNNILKQINMYKYRIKLIIYKRWEERKKHGSVLSHVTYYAVGNVGDTVLSKCVRDTFNKSGKYVWKLINVSDPVNDGLIHHINQRNAVIIGGGGLFLPDTNRNVVSGWQWAVSTDQIKVINVPIIIFSVGYNFFKGQETTELFNKNIECLIKKASFVGLRNNGSVEAIKKIVGSENSRKIVFQPCTTTLIRKIYGKKIPDKKRTNIIGVNIAFDREKNRFGDNKELILSQIAKAIKEIQDKGYKIYYFLHVEKDIEFLKYLDSEHVEYKVKNLSRMFPMECIKIYNDVDLMIGMRGHSQMIPFGLNCEIITLGSHDKMKWFLQDINCMDWYIDINKDISILKDTIVGKFVDIHEIDNKGTHDRLLREQEKLWRITQENIKIITDLVNQ